MHLSISLAGSLLASPVTQYDERPTSCEDYVLIEEIFVDVSRHDPKLLDLEVMLGASGLEVGYERKTGEHEQAVVAVQRARYTYAPTGCA